MEARLGSSACPSGLAAVGKTPTLKRSAVDKRASRSTKSAAVSDPTTKLIETAVAAAGGEEALAEYLHITPMLLRQYQDGQRSMPDFLFLRTVDLILATLRTAKERKQPESSDKPGSSGDVTPRAA